MYPAKHETITALLFDQLFLYYYIITDLHLIWIMPQRGDLNPWRCGWIYHFNRATLAFFMKLLVSAYT